MSTAVILSAQDSCKVSWYFDNTGFLTFSIPILQCGYSKVYNTILAPDLFLFSLYEFAKVENPIIFHFNLENIFFMTFATQKCQTNKQWSDQSVVLSLVDYQGLTNIPLLKTAGYSKMGTMYMVLGGSQVLWGRHCLWCNTYIIWLIFRVHLFWHILLVNLSIWCSNSYDQRKLGMGGKENFG